MEVNRTCINILICVVSIIGVVYCRGNYIEENLKPVRSHASSDTQQVAVGRLISRLIGDRSVDIVVDIQPSEEGYAKLNSIGRKLKISGNDAVSVAYAFNHYLKYYCRKQISWAGDQISNIPNPLPSVPARGVVIKAGVNYRYYQNVCTVSYSSVWWNWTRWEREIDWMALNGINLPLAFTGQEAIWERVYKKLGFTDYDLNHHFTGPAFLAWGRMGNLKGWGGPLPASWKKSQLALQHQILIRMRELGMIPVLPGFAGHVPSSITALFPKAEVIQLSHWSQFNCTYSCTFLLQPHDPLFKTIGSMFIKEQMIEYNGTNHIYNADTFNEMTPPSSDTGYLSNASRAVYEAMSSADPHAVWLMQGWLFHHEPTFWKAAQRKALLTGVPKGKMLILDLFSEAYPQYPVDWYFGQPFIWCMLNDFGGNDGFYGKIGTINTQPEQALTHPNSTMVGTGITPEGINQNYMIYDFMLETGFTVRPTNITSWLDEYAMRRYNTHNANALKTWNILGTTIYDDSAPGFPPKSLIRGSPVKRPSLTNPGLPYWYQYSSLATVWDNFYAALDELDDIETVRYDAVDITRQMLQTIHRILYYAMIEEFQWKRDPSSYGSQLLELMEDFDRILCSDAHFTMGEWIHDARALGTNEQEKELYEFNARMQVTLWGPGGEILDYANKHWCSLVEHYYRPRWALFIQYLNHAYQSHTEFNHKKFDADVFANVEEPFTRDRTVFPSTSTGEAIELAKEMYNRWRPLLNQI